MFHSCSEMSHKQNTLNGLLRFCMAITVVWQLEVNINWTESCNECECVYLLLRRLFYFQFFVVICCLHFEFGVRLISLNPLIWYWISTEKKSNCIFSVLWLLTIHLFIFVCVYSLDASLIYTLRTKNNKIDFEFFRRSSDVIELN